MANSLACFFQPRGLDVKNVARRYAQRGVQLAADLIRNDFNMNVGEIGMSLAKGALSGTLAGISGGVSNGMMALGGAISG
jgi:hypothetical protein